MTRKNLWDWWYNGINGSEKKRLEEIGIDASSSGSKTYYLNDLKKILENESVLKRRSHPITGQIHFIIFFSTWFNNDCMVIINGNSNYTLWICVYEERHRSFGEWLAYNSISTESSFSTAKDKARTLRWNIDGNNPVIYRDSPVKITYHGESSSPEMSLVGRSELPTSLSDPDDYIKPLDIVKVYSGKMLHSGIYLGSKKVAHAVPRADYCRDRYYGAYYGGYDYASSDSDQVSIIEWSKFRKFWMKSPEKIVRIKVTIPFKHREDIIRHIAKAYVADGSYYSAKGKFSLAGNNCEHLVNRCVLGLDFSEHAEIKKEKDAREKGNSYYKTERIGNLQSKISQTGDFLDDLTSSTWKTSDIRSYMIATPAKYGEEFNYNIEVEPKYGYKFRS